MKKQTQGTSRVVVAGRQQTHETITLRDTWVGAWLFFLGQLIVRIGAFGFMSAWMVVTGRLSGFFVTTGLLASLIKIQKNKPRISFDFDLLEKHQTEYKVGVIIALFMISMYAFGIWPHVFWEFDFNTSQMLLKTGGVYADDGTFWRGAATRIPMLLAWARFIFIGASAWILWTPSKILHWVFEIEQIRPKQREAGVGQINPASVKGPHGETYGEPLRRTLPIPEIDEEETAEDYDYHIE